MKYFIYIFTLLFTIATASAKQSVGLVLSGGGAKGIAHIGVIKALEDNDIPIDYVTGTSMGAIVGGLYAAGYTTDEMMQLLQSKEFAKWSTGQVDEKLTYFFFKDEPRPAMFNFAISPRDSTKTSSILPTSVISPLPMNFAFMELFSGYTAQCDGNFDNLFVPFRCVASDVYSKKKVICKSGSLGDAIRASMSFPIVFHPIEIDGVTLYDGGIYDNFPTDVMKTEFAPGIMIGVDVALPEPEVKSTDLVQQLEDMIIQDKNDPMKPEDGIYIHVDLTGYNLLDFPKAQAIYQIGYNRAMEFIDSIKARIPDRTPAIERQLRREVFKSKTPSVVFQSVNITGGTPSQNNYLERTFNTHVTDTFGIEHAKAAYYRAITGGKLKNFLPTAVYDNNTGMFDLNLKATVKDNLNIGFGGWITSSSASMLYLSGRYYSLDHNSINAGVNAWVGKNYFAAEATGRLFLPYSTPSSFSVEAVVSRTSSHTGEQFFYETDDKSALYDTQIFGRLHFSRATSRRSLIDISAGFGHLVYSYLPPMNLSYDKKSKDKSIFNLWQLKLAYRYNSLNNDLYPTSGLEQTLSGAVLQGQYHYYPDMPGLNSEKDDMIYGKIHHKIRYYAPVAKKFSLGIEYELSASSRKLLSTYNQSIMTAERYIPTPSQFNSFNHRLNAYSFVAAGLTPIIKLNDNLQIRSTFQCFLPMRRIKPNADGTARYGNWFADPTFFGEAAVVYSLPFASISLYGNYLQGDSSNWGGGISFGLFFTAPRFN